MSLALETKAVQLGTVMCASISISKQSCIVIAGAGIGGLATALALQRRGFNPVVCERSPELNAVGAGLLLSPNGVRALELLGLREKASSVSRVIREWRILNRDAPAKRSPGAQPASGRSAVSLPERSIQRVVTAGRRSLRLPPG
jgi:2-polyprenyl-6-methoxyphenol hydroxylase-like FAD-dependent oxidoreductase